MLPGRTQFRPLPPFARDDADHPRLAGRGSAADRDPLVHQRGTGDPPAVADRPEPVRVRDPYVGQEHLVELGLAGDLPQRPYLHAGRGHVTDEVRDPVVLGYVRIGTGDEDREARLVRHRRPHLLPVDDPAIACAKSGPRSFVLRPGPGVEHRPGTQRGEVGAGTGFAEQLAPHLLTGPQWTEEPLALLVRTVPEDRRGGHPEPDADAQRVVVRGARGGELAVHDRLRRSRRTEPAEAGREAHPREPGVVPGSQERQSVHSGRIVLGEKVPHELPWFVSVHQHPRSRRAWTAERRGWSPRPPVSPSA